MGEGTGDEGLCYSQAPMNQRQLLRSAAFLLALGLVSALGACAGDVPDGRVYDLAADLPLAEIRKEVGGIDFGTAASRVHLAGGWYANERGEWEGPTFAWSRGPVSVVEFDVLAPRDLRAEARCQPLQLPGRPQQVVAVELNGRRIAELALTPGFREYTFTLPGDGLVTGRNRLAFRYGWTAPPGRTSGRRVAVAWDFLRFRPAPQASAAEPRVEGKGAERGLFVPFGVEVDYFLELAEKGSFRHRGLAARGRSGGRLVLGVQQEGEEERTLELGEEDGAVEVPLPGEGRRLLRLGHVALVALGMFNVLFSLLPQTTHVSSPLMPAASVGWLGGGVAMPLVCFLAAWKPALRPAFVVPVILLLLAAALTAAGGRP